MTNDNEQLRKIKEMDIAAYVTGLGDDRKIKPLEIEYRRVVNSNRVLRDYTEDINLVVDGLYQWCQFLLKVDMALSNNQKVTPAEFEAVYIAICKGGIVSWIEYHFDWAEFYPDVTGHSLDEERLLALRETHTQAFILMIH